MIDRIQTGGPGQLNIPEEKIYELGNQHAVGVVRDIPDLSFDLESLDVSTEFESVLLAKTPVAPASIGTTGNEYDFNKSIPIDVVSPFKSTNTTFDIVRGLVVPCLSLETVTYRFGVRQSSVQSFTLRGDSIYYIPGVPHWEEAAIQAGAGQEYNFTYPGASGSPAPVTFTEQGNQFTALSVTLVNKSNGAYKRLFFGEGYTQGGSPATAESFFITEDYSSEFTHVRWTYGSDGGSGVEYDEESTSPHGSTTSYAVHQGASVKPAAVRGKDIKVYVGDGNTTNTGYELFRGVQTVEVTRSVNLENDEELGNHHYVAQDYVTPDVTGSFAVKPIDAITLWDQIAMITGVDPTEAIGPQTSATVPVKIEILHPDDGDVLKSIWVPDARFQVPGLQGRANQKVETTFNFTSDGGKMFVYDGEM